MGDYLRKITIQISDFLKGLTPVRKAAVAGTSAAIIFGITGIFFWAGDTTYTTLMSNLSPEDSTHITRILRDKHIPFKVDPTGKSISIPPESVHEFRLELATMGLPQSGVVGYELFDKSSIGTTSFIQKVNQKRALEGELMRTIGAIRGVKRARVHLAMPQKSTFIEDQKKSTASVVLDLEAGTQLNEKQVYGIGNLVARAVEGMDMADVVIMDSNGKVISKNPSDSIAAANMTQLDYQRNLESGYEKSIESILSRVVGEGRVVAKVTADLDFSQVHETQTMFDSDGTAVRSVEKKTDTLEGSRPGPYGAAGANANSPNQANPPNPEIKNRTNKNNEVVNYEVPQTVRKTTRQAGALKKLSVAVVVDGKHVKEKDKTGNILSKVEPWGADKLKEFEDLIAGAVGIDRKRGDSLDVKNMEFTSEDFEDAQKLMAEKERKSYVQNMAMYGVIGLGIIFFFMFVVRPFIKWITENTIDSVDSFLPQTIEELEKIQKSSLLQSLDDSVPIMQEKLDPEKLEGEMIKEKIVTMVDSNPHKAALILRDWLHQEKKKDDKDEGLGGRKPATA
jgi:flagellar M-ring protein FliF